jgi:hypothetical protein
VDVEGSEGVHVELEMTLIYCIFAEHSLNVHLMFTLCSLNVYWRFTEKAPVVDLEGSQGEHEKLESIGGGGGGLGGRDPVSGGSAAGMDSKRSVHRDEDVCPRLW